MIAGRLTRATAIARLALALGRVDRATFHEDGERPESDTDHTVMLALLAADVACGAGNAAEAVHVDVGLVVQFALVHDVVEAKAGDVVSIALTDAQRAEKARREEEALAELAEEYGETSWLVQTIRRYEAQDTVEARLVNYLDKVVPKLTHALNAGVALARLGLTPETAGSHNAEQGARLRAKNPDLQLVTRLFEQAHEVAIARFTAQRWQDRIAGVPEWTERFPKLVERWRTGADGVLLVSVTPGYVIVLDVIDRTRGFAEAPRKGTMISARDTFSPRPPGLVPGVYRAWFEVREFPCHGHDGVEYDIATMVTWERLDDGDREDIEINGIERLFDLEREALRVVESEVPAVSELLVAQHDLGDLP